MKKNKNNHLPYTATPELNEEIGQIIRKKKIQNKVLKELIEQLKKYPVNEAQSIKNK